MSVELTLATDGRITSALGDIKPSVEFDGSQPPKLVVIASDAVGMIAEQPHTDNGLTTTVTKAEERTYLHLSGPAASWTWELQPAHWSDPEGKPAVMLGELRPA